MTGPVFVTGGSGFLGSFFIAHLLGQGIPVVALVREPLEAKLIPNLHAAAGPCHGAAKLPLELLRGVQGDVKQAGLGMAESEYTSLRSAITGIWHLAATFESSDRKGDDVRDTNVTGTRHILELAAQEPKITFNLVSTAFAAPVVDNVAREQLSEQDDPKSNAYERSKVEAERLAQEFANRCAFDLAILRPSIVIGDSQHGISLGHSGYQGVFRSLFLLKRRLEVNLGADFDGDLKLRVDADPELSLNILPVDFVVEAMRRVAAARKPSRRIYNIASEHRATLQMLFDEGAATLGVTGIHLSRQHDYEARPQTLAERLFHRRIQFQAPYMLRNVALDTTNFRRLVPPRTLPTPIPDTALMGRCNRHCLQSLEHEFGLDLADAVRNEG